jgi:acyl-CoA thioesterase-1
MRRRRWRAPERGRRSEYLLRNGSIRVALLSLTLALAAGCGSNRSPTDPSPGPDPPPVRTVVVLGDSLAVSPSLEQSFPSRLQARVESERLRWRVTNGGISGDTTAGGVRRVEALLGADVGVLVLALGANDGLSGVDLGTIERNLWTIVEAAQRRGIRVLLCGMETPPSHGLDYSIGFHGIFPRVAQRYSIALVPFLLTGVAFDPDLTGPDGVHPNAAGAARIAENVWPYLAPLLM